ncbi:MAG: 3'-5' exonuclease [Flavobacteriaceae bacterium]|nr:3'-5' exonuclease [Flavobacteriaceae bacterium]
MNLHIKLENVLFLDIETVPQNKNWKETSEQVQALFAQKTAYQRKDEVTAEDFYERAGIWAEFGKIVCISVGFFTNTTHKKQFRVKSFFGDDEKELLVGFKKLLDQHFYKKEDLLCAHNGKEFDFPYIARRMIIHQIELPKKLNLFGKKPWEISHLDTIELWKFGDYKHYSSLKLLTIILGIPSPKDDIDGSEVARVYYQEKDIDRIVAYCEKDTIAVAQIILRLNNEPLLEENQIIRA